MVSLDVHRNLRGQTVQSAAISSSFRDAHDAHSSVRLRVMLLVGLLLALALGLGACGKQVARTSSSASPSPAPAWSKLPRFGKVVTLLPSSARVRTFSIDEWDSQYVVTWTNGKSVYLRKLSPRLRTIKTQTVARARPGDAILDVAMDYPYVFWTTEAPPTRVQGANAEGGDYWAVRQSRWDIASHTPGALCSDVTICSPYVAWKEASKTDSAIYLLDQKTGVVRPATIQPSNGEMHIAVSEHHLLWNNGGWLVARRMQPWSRVGLGRLSALVTSGPEMSFTSVAMWIASPEDQDVATVRNLFTGDGEILDKAPSGYRFDCPATDLGLAAWAAVGTDDYRTLGAARVTILAHRVAIGWDMDDEWQVWAGKLDTTDWFGRTPLDVAGSLISWQSADGRVMAASGKLD